MTNFVLYVATVFIWGSTWYAIDFQLGVVDPGVSLAYRFLVAALLAFAWCQLRGLALRFSLRTHGYFLLLGLFLFGLNYLSAYAAQFYISSALNAIGFSSMVWMNIINSRLFFGRSVTPAVLTGALLGIAGILIIFLPEMESLSFGDRVSLGMLFSLLGTLLASLGNMVSQSMQNIRVPVMQANAWGMLYGGVLNGLLAILRGAEFNFDPSPGYVLSLLYLATVGSVVAFSCYLTLLGRIGLERAGYAAVMIPIVALGFSVLLDDMRVSLTMLLGLSLAVAGNVFVLSGGRRPAAKTMD